MWANLSDSDFPMRDLFRWVVLFCSPGMFLGRVDRCWAFLFLNARFSMWLFSAFSKFLGGLVRCGGSCSISRVGLLGGFRFPA